MWAPLLLNATNYHRLLEDTVKPSLACVYIFYYWQINVELSCLSKKLISKNMPSSSCMRIMNHSWSATKWHLHPQSVAEISHHSVLSGDRIRQCGTSSGSRPKKLRTQISVCKSPFPSAGIAVSLFRAKTVQQRPLLPREVETRLQNCGSHTRWELNMPLMILTQIIYLDCELNPGPNGCCVR